MPYSQSSKKSPMTMIGPWLARHSIHWACHNGGAETQYLAKNYTLRFSCNASIIFLIATDITPRSHSWKKSNIAQRRPLSDLASYLLRDKTLNCKRLFNWNELCHFQWTKAFGGEIGQGGKKKRRYWTRYFPSEAWGLSECSRVYHEVSWIRRLWHLHQSWSTMGRRGRRDFSWNLQLYLPKTRSKRAKLISCFVGERKRPWDPGK